MSAKVKPFIDERETSGARKKWSDKAFHVGARYVDDGSAPVADIYLEDGWIHIVTDDYEGHAMLHAETIPLLRRALAKLDAERKRKFPK